MKKIIMGLLMISVFAFAADEIAVDAKLKVENGSFSLTRQVSNYRLTQTTSKSDYGIKAVATTTNDLGTKNVSTSGYSFFRNLGTNPIVLILQIRLGSNDVAILPLSTTGVTHHAVSGASTLEYWINER